MSNVSNKTLVALLIIAIFTTLGGLGIILSRLGFGFDLITGVATVQYGTVNVTITATAAITMTTANLTFGSGTIDVATGAQAVINTTINSSMYSNSYNSFTPNVPALVLRNDGNTRVNISFTGTTAANFIGGTGPAFKINVTNNEAGACSGLPNPGSGNPNYNLTAEVIGTALTACNLSNFGESQDEINISVWLWIPSDAIAGLKNATITFTATAT